MWLPYRAAEAAAQGMTLWVSLPAKFTENKKFCLKVTIPILSSYVPFQIKKPIRHLPHNKNTQGIKFFVTGQNHTRCLS